MREELESLRQEALEELKQLSRKGEFESFQVKYLGRKGLLTTCMRSLGALSPEERPLLGGLANRIKREVTEVFEAAFAEMASRELRQRVVSDALDVTLPGDRGILGCRHPISRVLAEIIEVFRGMGFELESGPETENEWYNFDALNIPGNHPARDMHDTIYLDGGFLLRTHTSPVQIRTMEKQAPPVRMICAGKTFRADTADASHSPMFHQLEGLMVDKDISFAQLKGVLHEFVGAVFGPGTRLRFRPSFFPFTEPSAEVDISCIVCGGAGCRLCSRRGWLEILGAGMVDPKVFAAVGYDPEVYTGFAFGLGIDRIAMLKYRIDDIRLFYENDLRFLHQF